MDVQLLDGRTLAEISDLFTTAGLDFQTSAAGELTVSAVDPSGMIPDRMLAKGTVLTVDGQRFRVAATERNYRGPSVRELTWTAYSRLAGRLRADLGPSDVKGVTPAEWITQRARKAGGRAVVQPGARKRKIVQERGQSALAVVESLATDMNTAWVEHSNTLWVGTPWWALHTEGLGLPMWDVRYGSEPVLGLTARTTDADRTEEGSATLRVDAGFARQVRPWHSVLLKGVHPDDAGLWLVSSLGLSLSGRSEAVDITLSRPKRSVLKKSTDTGGEDSLVGEGQWIQDRDRVWPGCARTPAQYVKRALAAVGSTYPDRKCLQWVSDMVGKTVGGARAKYVWHNRPASAQTTTSRTPPIGAIVVWDSPTGGIYGHVGISVGGGECISATGGRVVRRPIGSFGNYLGAVTPDFRGNYPAS